MKKIKSGIYGLNELLDGGINQNSMTVVVGASGAGKTTFAIQFIKRGLELGQDGIFVSLDESKDQIIEEAIEMGWSDILDYIDDEALIFIDASGKNFTKFVKEELPGFAEEFIGSNTRVAIDPLTPVMWSIKDMYERREIIADMIKQFKKVGTVVCTLEEHGRLGDLSGEETIIPMYLADSVIHLRYLRTTARQVVRNIEIVKCRNSRHSEGSHKYVIIRGFGIIILRNPETSFSETTATKQYRDQLENSIDAEFPPHIASRVREHIKSLKDHEIDILKRDNVKTGILEEYLDDKNQADKPDIKSK